MGCFIFNAVFVSTFEVFLGLDVRCLTNERVFSQFCPVEDASKILLTSVAIIVTHIQGEHNMAPMSGYLDMTRCQREWIRPF